MNFHSRRIRLNKAKEQAQLETIPLDTIIKYVNSVLVDLKMMEIIEPQVDLSQGGVDIIDYKKIQEENELEDKNDILWMKFTKDGYLGAVTTGANINFQVPPSEVFYDKMYVGNWLYNTSAIIIHHLKKEWDDSFVLIFPLRNMPSSYYCVDVERTIENYLIDKKVPILDYYHNIRV